MKKTNILFDLDGTLTDPMIGITKSVQYALAHYGIEVSDLQSLVPFIGPPLKGSFEKYYGFCDAQAEDAVRVYREYFSQTGLFENAVYPGIPELLKKLTEQGFQLYVATSKPTVFATQILDHFGLSCYFNFIGGSLLSGERVEKDDVIRYVLRENNIKKETATMVGDRIFDIEGAKKCGISAIGVRYGYGEPDEFVKADAVADTVEEIGRILGI
ncbi:MAG: HAD family hydrolase [Ruminococcaceae bacterium]|nr:HAD family hydrolase [Oscillospiraceae bacterium]